MVERYQEQERTRPVNQTNVRVSTTPETFGAGIGAGMRRVGEGVFDVARVMAARQQVEDESAAREAANQYIERARQLRLDPSTGYLSQTGAHALQARPAYEEALRSTRDEIGDGLSPAARRAYEQATDTVYQGALEQGIQHHGRELRRHANQASEAFTAGLVNEALLSYRDQQATNALLTQALEEVDRIGALNGWSGEVLAEARRNMTSSIRTGVATRLLGEPLGAAAAQAYVEQHKDDFSAEHHRQLTDTLRPLVAQQAAMRWVGERTGAGYAPADGYARAEGSPRAASERSSAVHDHLSGYTDRMTQRESAGRLDAAPRNADGSFASSARGPYQFVERTWLNLVRDLQSQGGARWATGLSDEDILEYRWTGGALRGHDDAVMAANEEVEAEHQRQNATALRQGGLPVNPTTMYFMHHFGVGEGRQLLGAGPGRLVADVVRAQTLAANPYLRGKTVGWLRSRVSRDMGSGAPTSAQHRDLDFPMLYAEALQIEDPQQRDLVLRELDTRQRVFDMQEKQEREELFDTAYERGVRTDDWQLSGEEALRLGADGVRAFQDAARVYQTGVQHTDPHRLSALKDMAVEDTDAFLTTDLEDELAGGRLTSDDYMRLRDLQRELRAQPSPAQRVDTLLHERRSIQNFNEVSSIFFEALGVDAHSPANDEQRRQVGAFRAALDREVAALIRREGREVGQGDLQDMAARLLTPVEVEGFGWFGGTSTKRVPLFDVEHQRKAGGNLRLPDVVFGDIPATSAELMLSSVAEMHPTLGRAEMQAMAARMYSNMRRIEAGFPPEVVIEDVPEDWIADTIQPAGRSFGRGGRGREAVYEVRVDDGSTREMTESELLALYASVLAAKLQVTQTGDE